MFHSNGPFEEISNLESRVVVSWNTYQQRAGKAFKKTTRDKINRGQGPEGVLVSFYQTK